MAVEFVDVSDIHLRDIRFEITRDDGRVFNFSDLVTQLTWDDHVNTAGAEANISLVGSVADVLQVGGEGSSCRVSAPLVDLDSGKLVRRELWQGTFEEVVDNRTEGQIERIATGYDIARFLSSNEEDYVFTNSTLSQIVEQVVQDLNIPVGTIAVTSEPLGQIVIRGRTIWDLFQEAVQRHADLNGDVYYIYADQGRISMRLQGDQARYWVYETGESIRDVRRTRSLSDMINQVKVYGVFDGDTDKPSVEATKTNADSIALYGQRQRIEYLSSAGDDARVLAIAQQILDRYAAPEETLELTGWLIPSLRAGDKIRFIDSEWGIDRIYFVESISSTWSPDRAESVASVRRVAVDPDLLLEEVTAV